MIPKFRAWDKETKTMLDVSLMDFKKSVLIGEHWEFGETNFINFDDVNLMQSTGLHDKNGEEIFDGDILKFNDEFAEYCYEGYVDGSSEGINYVEIEKEKTCFTFGKTKIPESSLIYLVENEHYSFGELLTEASYEFEIIGNIYENPELLEVTE